jgi:ArsR family transcriptional regulator
MRDRHDFPAEGSSSFDASGTSTGPRCVSTPETREIQEASELMKVVGDLTRMRILCTLLPGEELSVGELQRALDMSQSAVSHQLRVLRDANLVRFRRAGKLVYYSLTDQHVHELLLGTLEHIRHD